MNRILYFLFVLFTSCRVAAQDSIVLNRTTLEVRIVADDLHVPWELQWGPDDHLWCSLRNGYLVRIHPAAGSKDTLLDLSTTVYQEGENGLLGFAIDPDWKFGTQYVYVAYTVPAPTPNDPYGAHFYAAKYQYLDSTLQAPQTLAGPIPAWLIHSGSRLMFLPDKSLLITVGDANRLDAPLSLDSLNGKILRLWRDGSIPPNNPYPNSPVYTYGHRNPQGLVRLPDGRIFSSEHGPDSDDELNALFKGRCWGWPLIKGFCDTPEELDTCSQISAHNPEIAWTPTLAVSDLIYYDHDAIPEWKGSLLMTTLKEMDLRQLSFDGISLVEEAIWLDERFGRLRDICTSPNGRVFIATNHWQGSNPNLHNHKIVELKAKEPEPVAWVDPGLTIYQQGERLHLELSHETDSIVEWRMVGVNGRVIFSSGQIIDSPPAHASTGIYTLQVIVGRPSEVLEYTVTDRIFWYNQP